MNMLNLKEKRLKYMWLTCLKVSSTSLCFLTVPWSSWWWWWWGPTSTGPTGTSWGVKVEELLDYVGVCLEILKMLMPPHGQRMAGLKNYQGVLRRAQTSLCRLLIYIFSNKYGNFWTSKYILEVTMATIKIDTYFKHKPRELNRPGCNKRYFLGNVILKKH